MVKNGILKTSVDWLVSALGYTTVIKLKDFTLFLTGVTIGVLIMAVLIGRTFSRIRQVENLGRLSLVKFKHNGKILYFAQTKTFCEAVEVVMMIVLLPFIRKREYTLADKKRTKTFVYAVFIVVAVMIVLSFLFITHPMVTVERIPVEWK